MFPTNISETTWEKMLETFCLRLASKIINITGKENIDDVLDKLEKTIQDFKEKYEENKQEELTIDKLEIDLINFLSENFQDLLPNFNDLVMETWSEYLRDIGLY